MKKNFSVIVSIFLTLTLWRCAPQLVIGEYSTLDIDSRKASHEVPDYIVNKKKPRVAILPPADNTAYKKCQVYNVGWEYLVQTLASAGLEVVERSQLEEIMKEMKFQAGITGDIDVNKFAQIATGVDSVFVGSISQGIARAEFREGRTTRGPKGETYYTPPSCQEEGRASLSIRLVKFPEGVVRKTFLMEGKESLGSREVRSSYECQVVDPCGVLAKAIRRAIDNSREDILREFPFYGYIYKTMTHPKDRSKRIAFVNLGRNDGLEAGSKLEIVEFVKERDPIKGSTMLRAQTIGECKVSQTDLEADKSICIVSEEAADKVSVGHVVRLKVEEGFFRKIEKYMHK